MLAIPPFVEIDKESSCKEERNTYDIKKGIAKPLFVPITDQMEELLDDIRHKTKHAVIAALWQKVRTYLSRCSKQEFRDLGHKETTAHGQDLFLYCWSRSPQYQS